MKKYEVCPFIISFGGITVHRIRALIDIPRHGVKAGDLGGYVEDESNLSQDGDCWITGSAKVYEGAKVVGNAIVRDKYNIYGGAVIGGDIDLHGKGYIFGNVKLGGEMYVSGDVFITSKNGR